MEKLNFHVVTELGSRIIRFRNEREFENLVTTTSYPSPTPRIKEEQIPNFFSSFDYLISILEETKTQVIIFIIFLFLIAACFRHR